MTKYQIVLPPLNDDDDRKVLKAAKTAFFKKVESKTRKLPELLQLYHGLRHKDFAAVKALLEGHTDLILQFHDFFPEAFKLELPPCKGHHQLVIKDKFLNQVKRVFQYKMEIYFDFLQLIKDHNTLGIDARGVAALVKDLFQGHTNLMLEFNKYTPKQYHITFQFHDFDDAHHTGKQLKVAEENCQLPWDVLDIISKYLDLDDLFQFACVCKNWRAFHKNCWTNFLVFQEPLLVQKSSCVKKYFSFISIPNQKVYHSNMVNYFWHFSYFGSSSGYLIMAGNNNNSFMLINPFTRRKKVISTSPPFQICIYDFSYNVLLAFNKGSSEEFVLVVLDNTYDCLYVYQSRYLAWYTYSTKEHPWQIVDFVVLHNTIYVVTNKASIGVLSLNSKNIKFLKLNNTPSVTYYPSVFSSTHLRLVSCDGQLLLLYMFKVNFSVYNVDLSTMNFVKLESLGNIALFYAVGESYRALSNPERWGYKNNSVYVIDNKSSTKCKVYLGDDNKLPKYIKPPPHLRGRPYLLDWCFPHLHYEVDYSLVE